MKYGVKILADGSIPENSKTNDFEKARETAISFSNWNMECEIVDLETNEPIKHFSPYARINRVPYARL